MAAAQSGPNNGTPAADVAPRPPSSRLTSSFCCTSDSYVTGDSYHMGDSPTMAPQLYGTCSKCGVENNEFTIASQPRLLQDIFVQHQEREKILKTRIKFLTDKYEEASRLSQEQRRRSHSGIEETLKILNEGETKLKEHYRKELDQIINLYESEQKQNTLLLLSLKIYEEYLGAETIFLIEENNGLKEKQLEYTAVKKERDELRVTVSIFGILATALFAFVLFKFPIAPEDIVDYLQRTVRLGSYDPTPSPTRCT
ncbi:hypothetical protein TWF102_006974 [Orbilia oligospora]|uniref:Uncharacterized protein n=1 Tax=Orbilia oligospora TaxID=2813651 RepID=A0A7C8NI53_ORBOL|nr:hypothetical protein TWF103_005848 [Orbilia oligospora]KAF3111301.1 hypothetical protein TWF102_006974 [Orbilia oligospora]